MLIGDGWAFIHIPKCGGTSLRSALKGTEVAEVLPLSTEQTVDHRYHWIARERPVGRVFTVVRHPAAWLRSYWGHRQRHGWRKGMKLDRFKSDDVNAFLLRVAQHEPGYVGRLFSAYAEAYDDVKVFMLEYGLETPLRYALGQSVSAEHRNSGRSLTALAEEAVRAVEEAEGVL